MVDPIEVDIGSGRGVKVDVGIITTIELEDGIPVGVACSAVTLF